MTKADSTTFGNLKQSGFYELSEAAIRLADQPKTQEISDINVSNDVLKIVQESSANIEVLLDEEKGTITGISEDRVFVQIKGTEICFPRILFDQLGAVDYGMSILYQVYRDPRGYKSQRILIREDHTENPLKESIYNLLDTLDCD